MHFVFVIMLVFGMFMSATAFAAGGQVQVGNPIFGDDCVAAIPAGLELADCEFVSSSPSGLQYFFVCGEISVICNADDGGDPGSDGEGDGEPGGGDDGSGS